MLSDALNVRQIAKKLNVGPESIYQMIHKKQIPYFKVGGRVRFDEQQVMDYFMKVKSDPQQ